MWNGSGSGCSAYIAENSWQRDPNCTMRTTADVSAVADPETGVAVYNGYRTHSVADRVARRQRTSASAPYVAGLIGLKGTGATFTNRMPYAEPSAYFDTIGGDNGTCGGDYLCKGLKGYDAPASSLPDSGSTGSDVPLAFHVGGAALDSSRVRRPRPRSSITVGYAAGPGFVFGTSVRGRSLYPRFALGAGRPGARWHGNW